MCIIVSSCLLGEKCRYNASSAKNSSVIGFVKGKSVISICPELLAGVGTPRTPVEIFNNKVIDKNGNDCDTLYRNGVSAAIKQVKGLNIKLAILKSKSPTCGIDFIYDGSFSKTLIAGHGIFAQELIKCGIRVVDENFLDKGESYGE